MAVIDNQPVLRSFGDPETERVATRLRSRRLPPEIQRIAQRKLMLLNAATALNELRVPPGNRLEPLVGRWEGFHSIRINDQWRICFRWHEGEAYEVQIRDYH